MKSIDFENLPESLKEVSSGPVASQASIYVLAKTYGKLVSTRVWRVNAPLPREGERGPISQQRGLACRATGCAEQADVRATRAQGWPRALFSKGAASPQRQCRQRHSVGPSPSTLHRASLFSEDLKFPQSYVKC